MQTPNAMPEIQRTLVYEKVIVYKQRAKDLHRLAKVPEGPCRIKELNMFQNALPEYQIKVLSVDNHT